MQETRQMANGSFTVLNDKGLHTRPSTELVKCALRYKSQIHLLYQNMTVDAKSLLGILALAASKGSKIEVETFGEDCQLALDAIVELAYKKFNIHY